MEDHAVLESLSHHRCRRQVFISGIHNKYDLEYHFVLLGIFCAVCLVLGAICFKVDTFSKDGISRDDRLSGTAAHRRRTSPFRGWSDRRILARAETHHRRSEEGPPEGRSPPNRTLANFSRESWGQVVHRKGDIRLISIIRLNRRPSSCHKGMPHRW